MKLSSSTLVHNIGQLVTLQGAAAPRFGAAQRDLSIVSGGAVLVSGGLIVSAGTEAEVLATAKSHPSEEVAEIDAGGRLVTPGLVDAHTHLVHSGTREREFELRALGATYSEIMDAGGGIYATVEATRAASLDSLVESAKRNLAVMLSYGTTTCEAKSGYGLDLETELRQLEAIRILNAEQPVTLIPTYMGAHAVPRGMESSNYIDWLCETALPAVREQGIARFNDVFCERGVFTPEQTEQVMRTGQKLGLAAKIHADELCDTGGAALAACVGAVSADHLHCASDDGLRAMAKAGTVAVLLPGTAVFLGLDAHAPARKMVDLGVPIALGTDFNPGSCYCKSLPLIMSFACSQLGLTPAEALVAATINAAYASGVGKLVGSFEPGKQADIVIWDTDDYRMIAYEMGARLAHTVIKRGQVAHSV